MLFIFGDKTYTNILQLTKWKICTYYFENSYYEGSFLQRQEEATISRGQDHVGTWDNVQIPVIKMRVTILCITLSARLSNIQVVMLRWQHIADCVIVESVGRKVREIYVCSIWGIINNTDKIGTFQIILNSTDKL